MGWCGEWNGEDLGDGGAWQEGLSQQKQLAPGWYLLWSLLCPLCLLRFGPAIELVATELEQVQGGPLLTEGLISPYLSQAFPQSHAAQPILAQMHSIVGEGMGLGCSSLRSMFMFGHCKSGWRICVECMNGENRVWE